jgi:hypothetical protein
VFSSPKYLDFVSRATRIGNELSCGVVKCKECVCVCVCVFIFVNFLGRKCFSTNNKSVEGA